MAAIKLDLEPGVWQEIGAIGFIFDKSRLTNMEFANTDSLPVGKVDAAFIGVRNELQVFPAPIDGSWFVRCASQPASFVFTEV